MTSCHGYGIVIGMNYNLVRIHTKISIALLFTLLFAFIIGNNKYQHALAVGGLLSPLSEAQPVELPALKVAEVEQAEPKAQEPSTQTPRQEVISYINEVFEDDAADAITLITRCEYKTEWKLEPFSPYHNNHFNKNKTIDYGLFMINSVHEKRYGKAYQTDWKENVRVAHKIFEAQGWRPWVCAHIIGHESYTGRNK